MNINRYSAIAALLLTAYVPPAVSEYFIGVDYSAYNTFVSNSTYGDIGFYDAQQRIRLGYRGEWSGFEVDFLSEQDDTNASGYYNFKQGPAIGAYLYLYEKWVYGKLGILLTDSTLKNNTTGISDDYTLMQFSGAIGIQFEIIKHVQLNADYTYSYGDGEYRNALAGDDPTIESHSLAAGITLGF